MKKIFLAALVVLCVNAAYAVQVYTPFQSFSSYYPDPDDGFISYYGGTITIDFTLDFYAYSEADVERMVEISPPTGQEGVSIQSTVLYSPYSGYMRFSIATNPQSYSWEREITFQTSGGGELTYWQEGVPESASHQAATPVWLDHPHYWVRNLFV